MSVPSLRFKGFSESWASKKLDEITSYVDYRGKTPEKSDTGVFLVTAKNIRQGFIDYETSQEYIPVETYEEVMRRGKPLIGDVLITTEAPLGYVASVDREGIALAQRVIKLRGLEDIIENGFLKFHLVSDNFQKELFEKATGGTVKGIKGSVLHKMKLNFPVISEQTKIANFLAAVDEKITQLTQKCDLLAQYKKGVMQQIFSQELRFKDDDGRDFPVWKEMKLSELGKFIGGGTPKTGNTNFWNGNIPWVSSSDLTDESIFRINVTRFITSDAIAKSATKLVPKNSILIVSRVGVGKVAVTNQDICTSQDFTNLALYSGNQVFFAYLIKKITHKLLEFNQGTSI